MKTILIGLSLLASLSAYSIDNIEFKVFSEEIIQGASEIELESICKRQSMRREIDLVKATNTTVHELGKVPWIYHTSELDYLIKLNENSVHYKLTKIESSGWINKTYSGVCTVSDNKKLWDTMYSLINKVDGCYQMIEGTKITQENGKRICESTNQICHINLLHDMNLDEEDYAKVSRLCNVNLVNPQKCFEEFTSGNTIGGESSPAFGGYTERMAMEMCDPSSTIKNVKERLNWSLLEDLNLIN